MGEMFYEVRTCQYEGCQMPFEAHRLNQLYCCEKCKKLQHAAQARERRKYKREDDLSDKFKPVFEFIEQHYKETGEYIQYGKAVQLMEQKKASEKRGKTFHKGI